LYIFIRLLALVIRIVVNGRLIFGDIRRIEVTTIADSRDFAAAMDGTVATITFPAAASPWAFLIRAGA
jgi:hypothetical protein